MKNLSPYLLSLLFSLSYISIKAQPTMKTSYPEIGKRCPDFMINDLRYFQKRKVTLDDFKGKWLVLDFFSSNCTACVESFPKINELNYKFKEKVQVVLIGFPDKMVQPMYERFREKLNLNLPVTYNSDLFQRFDVGSAPYIIVVDDKGIVKGITYSFGESELKSFLSGENPSLAKTYRAHEDKMQFNFDIRKPFLVNENGGEDTDFLYRSVLSLWNPKIPKVYLHADLDFNLQLLKNKIQFLGVDLNTLYRLGYVGFGDWGLGGGSLGDSLYGKFYSSPILEVKDASPFTCDFVNNKYIYCYSLIFPVEKGNRKDVMKMIQRDLQNYFPYTVAIQIRKMPYWKLVASEDAKIKLRAKMDTSFFNVLPHAGVEGKNIPIRNLIRLLWGHHFDEVFIDETKIAGNIDLSLNCIFTDLNDVKEALQKNGLDLIRAEKDMSVLVIKDKGEE